jgi:putative membrane protein
MLKSVSILGAAAVALLPLAGASAQVAARPQPIAERMDSATKIFVKTARIAGAFEVESSQVALKRSRNPNIRAFAERMVADHTKLGERLDEVARRENMDVSEPTNTDKMVKKHDQLLATLRTADDNQFDRVYLQLQTAAHTEALQLFAAFAKRGDNEALKIYAQETLPVLLEHRKHLDGMIAS